jgi:hypothetical protein
MTSDFDLKISHMKKSQRDDRPEWDWFVSCDASISFRLKDRKLTQGAKVLLHRIFLFALYMTKFPRLIGTGLGE